jgi:hypothetical protein
MLNDDNGIRRVVFIRTIDGDTFVGDLLMAPQVRPKPKLEIAVRVENWNAAELSQAEGPFMRTQFDEALKAAHVITVRMKEMSFTRIVCAVFLDDLLFAGFLHASLKAFRSKASP